MLKLSEKPIIKHSVYVLPNYESLNADGFNRLFAFNVNWSNKPVYCAGCFNILDSGAFHLYHAKRKMDAKYVHSLFEFYSAYGKNDYTFCIAPDVLADSNKTMTQFETYYSFVRGVTIVPVIQLGFKSFDLYSVKKQADFYKPYKLKMFAFGNNIGKYTDGIRNDLIALNRLMRKILGEDIWIHILGAGFNCVDAYNWLRCGFNSCDSISYYTAAHSGEKWVYGTDRITIEDRRKWRATALHNAKITNDFLKEKFNV
jgi:hypothetical protein